MRLNRQLCILAVTLTTWGGQAAAQADSAPHAIPDLSGRWQISGLLISPTYLTIRQTDTQLRGEIAGYRRCRNRNVKVVATLEGEVEGHVVTLRVTDAHAEGDFLDPCVEYAVFLRSDLDFEGQISPDGKKIVGPYDHSGIPSHTWTLSR